MKQKQIVKISILTLITIIINIILYSKLGFGLRISKENPLTTSFIVTEIIGNILIYIYISYSILKEPTTKIYNKDNFLSVKDYIETLNTLKDKKIFSRNIDIIEKQIERLGEKYNTLNVILLQHFDENGMTYDKFINSINQVKNLFFNNVRKIINRMSIFNENDYKELKNDISLKSQKHLKSLEIYKEHIDYIEETIDNNNMLLIKLDNLILEISKINDNEEDDMINTQILQEIDDLINKTKLYS